MESQHSPMNKEPDQIEKEIHHEKMAELKVLFPALRDFYREASHHMDLVRTEFGDFPTQWQELQNWKHYKCLRKRYLAFLDGVILPPPETGVVNSLAKEEAISIAPEPPKSGKRSRWGAVSNESSALDEPPPPPSVAPSKRRSRWGEATALVPTDHSLVPSNNNSVLHRLGLAKTLTQEEQQEAMLLKVKIQQALINCEPSRILVDSLALPEVAPIYDAATGLRRNTPETRMREQRTIERDTLIEKMFALDPLYSPPAGYVRRKPSAKLYIPHKEYPTYNFIGLVIGPRGNTQKMMEKESRCKIVIRGRGSVKEGSRGRGVNEDENDELHVYVSGDSQADVDKAVSMVKPLLVPVNEETNEHKQSQLRELALINGTVKPDEYCPLCGEQGHRQFECPSHTAQSLNSANVRCTFCGETSHPSRDCPVERARKNDAGEPDNDHVVLDQEYNSFIAELHGDPTQAAPAAPAKGVELLEPNEGTTENLDSSASKPASTEPPNQTAAVETSTDPAALAQQQYYAQAYAQQQYMAQQYQAYGMQYDPVQGWYYPYHPQTQQPH